MFVFGSNEAGRHGKGVAEFARRFHGAVPGRGEGAQGKRLRDPNKRCAPAPDAVTPYLARFSPCRTWRYDLWRRWHPDGPMILWLLLNPSTADEASNDPTVERCERRSRAIGASGYYVCNIFALRSTHPNGLYTAADPVGPENDSAIMEVAHQADIGVCGWGNHGRHLGRGRKILSMLCASGIEPLCLKVTAPASRGIRVYWLRHAAGSAARVRRAEEQGNPRGIVS